MPQGLYVANNAGILQIDNTITVLSYMGVGSVTAAPANPVIGETPTYISLEYGAMVSPTVAIRSEQRMRFSDCVFTGINKGAWAFNPNYVNVTWEAYFFDTPRNTPNYGLVLYKPDGTVSFDGSKKLVVVHDTITLNPANNYTASRTYTTGRRYAVIAPGVYVKVVGATVSCEGMFTSVAAAGGTINAIVIDVTGY